MAAAQAETNAVKSQAAAIDVDNDPAFAPIEGVAYKDYVALCIKMQPAGTDEAKQLEIAKANGYDEAKWKAVSGGLHAALHGEPAVRASPRHGRDGGRPVVRIDRTATQLRPGPMSPGRTTLGSR